MLAPLLLSYPPLSLECLSAPPAAGSRQALGGRQPDCRFPPRRPSRPQPRHWLQAPGPRLCSRLQVRTSAGDAPRKKRSRRVHSAPTRLRMHPASLSGENPRALLASTQPSQRPHRRPRRTFLSDTQHTRRIPPAHSAPPRLPPTAPHLLQPLRPDLVMYCVTARGNFSLSSSLSER